MFREILLFLALGFSLNLFAQVAEDEGPEQDYWSITKTAKQWLDLNPVRFTNRASCAKDSKRPTESTFLLVDNLNLGRSLFRLGKKLGKGDDFTRTGVHRFRYTVTGLSKFIAESLLTGKLPLLPVGEESQTLKNYSEFLDACQGKSGHCPDMDDFLNQVWEGAKLSKLRQVDTFTQIHFLNNPDTPRMACHYLKQFSPLEAHLYGTKPKKDTLLEMARTVEQNENYLASCDDFTQQKDLKLAMFQLDLRFVDKKDWEKKGFNFWHSFKIYLSWAMRYSPEAEKLAFPYGNFFRNVDLEETIFFFSNGCRSLEMPQCSREDLSINGLRFLAQASDRKELSKLDLIEYVPAGPTSDVIGNSTPEVNNDILNLADFSSADSWAANFRENMEKARGFIKLKLSKALTQMSLVHDFVSVSRIMEDLENKKNRLLTGQMQKEEETLYRQELFYLCSEYRVALDERLSFLRDDLELLRQETSINSIAEGLTEKNLGQLLSIIDKLAPSIINHCDTLEHLKVWADPFVPEKSGLAPWFQEFARDVKDVKPSNLMSDLIKFQAPLLSFKDYKTAQDINSVICINGAHCSRRTLASLIDIYASLQYIEGLLNLSGKIKTPDLVNPYAERVACRAYDPWFKTKSTIFDFIQNMGLAATSTVIPTPVYLDAKIRPRQVISFDQLIKNGQVYYDPKFDKRRIEATLIADFGPLLGTPCMIQVSPNSQVRPGNIWYLNGITTQSCVETSRNNINVYGPSEIDNRRMNFTGCMSCTISISSVAGSASALYPGIRPIYFIVKGIVNLISNLRDPHNIPRSWEVDLNSVYSSYRKFGDIPKSCERRLRDEKSCLKDGCETSIVESFEKHFRTYVSDLNIIKGGHSEVWINDCPVPVTLKTPWLGCRFKNYPASAFNVPAECREKLERR